jgi:NADPH-dependent ferric siderophore reductase
MSSSEPVGRRVRHDLKLRLLKVQRIRPVTPKMVCITLAGETLTGFTSAAYDDHAKLFFPGPGQDVPVLPAHGPEGPKSHQGVGTTTARDFTPRRYDPAANELDFEFALHGHGPASSWAAQAKPGHSLGVAGPRGSFVLSREFDWYLLAGDETALPAIARRLEELHSHARALVVVEVPNSDEEQLLRSVARTQVRWVHRDAAESGSTDPLVKAIAALKFPDGEGYAWVAGESATVKAVRRHLVGERRLPNACVKAAAYWKRGATAVHETYDD